MNTEKEDELELYGDPQIATKDAKVPWWLYVTYTVLPIWGIFTLWYFWNGSTGWLDRGYWHQLQIAAKTTYPYNNKEKKEK